eukprot:3145048-Pyramimonas_sp.AAC.1
MSQLLEKRKALKGTQTGRHTETWQDVELDLARVTFRIRAMAKQIAEARTEGLAQELNEA